MTTSSIGPTDAAGRLPWSTTLAIPPTSRAGSVALAGPVPVSQTGAVIRSNVARHALRLAIGFRGR
jgi:hypothetical protein